MSAARVDILECDRRPTVFGEALRIKLWRVDGEPMGFRAVYDAFAARYPGRWAVQVFPPVHLLIDEAHKYHLYVFDEEPPGLNLCAPAPRGTRHPEAR